MEASMIKQISDIYTKNSKLIKYSLLKVCDYKHTFNEKEDPECAICYKHISNKVFVCDKPCNKTFHPSCMEKLIDRIEETADDDDDDDDDDDEQKKICYQCCYCRREFDINDYDTKLFIQELMYAKGCGYNIFGALTQCILNGMEEIEGQCHYDIFIPLETSHVKLPKQSKRATFKNKNKNTNKHHRQRVHMNKGRR
jgi:hypothetical protein